MSLHDVSKHDDQRLDPKANASDARPQRDAHGTTSVNYVTDATVALTGPSILGGIDRLVYSGTMSHTAVPGTNGTIRVESTSHSHGLGYSPSVRAVLKNATISGLTDTFDLPLPLPLDVGYIVAGTFEHIGIDLWMQYGVNDEKFFVITYSTGGSPGGTFDVTFYLYQQTTQ